ncbi:hypothetical protein [Paraburkholderia sp. JHI869]|uniref:hypothetical protein n=1 Tax=Paraburkholderia sp. JHI869 TaxID=3112959 RepID=UPI00318297E2
MEAEKSLSVAEFCALEGISKGGYYAMKRRNQAPAETHIGRRRVISAQSHREWRERSTPKRSTEAEATA